MKLLFDYLPIAVFVGIYFYSNSETPMYPAVQGLIVASIIQTIGSRLLTGKFEKLHLWVLLVTIVFGGMTLAFRDPAFVQWKASVVLWLTAGVFLFRQFVHKKYLIQDMMQAAIDEKLNVPKKTWMSVNLMWPIGYILFGFINLYVAFNFSEAFWVKFKLFGLFGFTLSLLIFTIVKLYPYLSLEGEDKTEEKSSSAVEKMNQQEATNDKQ